MKKQEREMKYYWLQQFTYFDGEYDTTFNILDVNTDKMIIKLAVDNTKIKVDDFETIND